MNNFNAMLYFKGEGSLTFILKKVGEITIYADKPIYLTGLDVSQVEALRNLRALKLEHKLNAKPDGCYKVINCATSKLDEYAKLRAEHIKKSEVTKEELANDITNIKKNGLNGPIIDDSNVIEDTKKDTTVEESPVISNNVEDFKEYILTSTKHKGKKISELSTQQIKANIKKANAEDKEALENYLSQNK